MMKRFVCIFIYLVLFYTTASAMTLRSNRDPRVDQDLKTTSSPTFAGLAFGGNPSIFSSAYEIQIKPSGDLSDYFFFTTVDNVPTIGTVGSCNLKITSSSGIIDFDDENLSTLGSITAAFAAEGSDVDKFLVDSSNTIKYRTGVQILSDIGAQVQGDVLDDFNTLGTVTHSQFIVGTGAGIFGYQSGATVRNTIELGTGNTPQFTGIELGHGSDTTLTRASAGVVRIEGVNIAMLNGLLEDLDTLGTNSTDSEFIVGTGVGALAWESGATVRTSLGLGIGDSPTFTNVYLGGGGEGDSFLYFYEGTSPTGASIKWNDTLARFEVSKRLTVDTSITSASVVATSTLISQGKATITTTGQQLELEYDGANQADFTVSSGGDLTITASGGDIGFGNENLSTTGIITSGDMTILDATPILVFRDSDSLGAASVGYIEWRDSGGGRAGFLGNNSSGNDDLFWKNEQGGNIGIQTTGEGELQIFANTVLTGTFAVSTTATIGDGLVVNNNEDAQNHLSLKGAFTTSNQRGGSIEWEGGKTAAIEGYTYTSLYSGAGNGEFVWDTAPQSSIGDRGTAYVRFNDGSASFAEGDFTIASTGRTSINDEVTIDVASPNSGFGLNVVYTTAGGGAWYAGNFFVDGNSAAAIALRLQGGPDTHEDGTDDNFIEIRDGDGSLKGYAEFDGGGGGLQWETASDERLKENFVPYSDIDILEKFKSIQPQEYNFKGSNAIVVGITAQELNESFPELVGELNYETIKIDLTKGEQLDDVTQILIDEGSSIILSNTKEDKDVDGETHQFQIVEKEWLGVGGNWNVQFTLAIQELFKLVQIQQVDIEQLKIQLEK